MGAVYYIDQKEWMRAAWRSAQEANQRMDAELMARKNPLAGEHAEAMEERLLRRWASKHSLSSAPSP